MNDSSNIEHSIPQLLEQKQFSKLISLLNDDKNQLIIKDNSLNLIDITCATINDHQESILKKPIDIDSCTSILITLVEKGNSKETLIGLLEAINKFNADVCFQLLLRPIQKVLFQVPKREHFLDYVLNVTNAHFYTIPKPENKNFEGKELLLLDLDPSVQTTADTLTEYLKFLKPFLEEASETPDLKTMTCEQVSGQKTILQKYLLKLLCRPFIFHDLHLLHDKQISSIQSSCQKLLAYLGKMCKNVLSLYICKDFNPNVCDDYDDDGDDSNNIPNLAFANLAYLLFAENMLPEYRPYTYASGYLFEKHIPLISLMLSRKEDLVTYKGLHLCKTLLDVDFVLPATDMSFSNFVEFSLSLINYGTYCTIESYRKLLGTLFISYIKKFSWETRYSLLLSLMNTVSDLGVQSLLIDFYKNFLHEAQENELLLRHFVGKNLHVFLRKALHLKDGVKTDILESRQSILSGLNIIRYLILVDSEKVNFTGIFNILGEIKKNYLDPLQLGIDISKAHYLLEANNFSNKILANKASSKDTITVNGEVLQISPQEHANAMKQAYVSLDLIQSVLSRVLEILDQKYT